MRTMPSPHVSRGSYVFFSSKNELCIDMQTAVSSSIGISVS